MTAVLRYVLRKFYFLCAIALITIAVLVQSGRSLSPLVSDYRADIERYISSQLNAQVTLGAIAVEWDGLKPVLGIEQLTVVSHGDLPILAVGQGRVRLDLLRSLWNRQLVWGSIKLRDTELTFEQTAQGGWRIPGLPQSDQKPADAAQLNTLVDKLLLANKIEFQSTRLHFTFVGGHHIALTSPSLLLENHQDFHRISLVMDVEDQQQAVSVVVEGRGDPRDQERFQARGYLALDNFPTSEPLAAATAALIGTVSENRLRSEGALNARLWFNSRVDNSGFDISGELNLQTLVVPLFERQYQLNSFSTAITGYWLRTGAWRLGLPGVTAQLQDARIDDVNLAVSAASYRSPLQIQVDQLQVAAGMGVLKETGILTPGMEEAFDALDPRGILEQVEFTLPLAEPAAWEVKARAHQLAVDAWRGVPKLTGVDGYIRASQRGGSINIESLNGFIMHYDPTYADAMEYQRTIGQVAWHFRPDEYRIYVNSGALRFQGEREEATGYLWLSIPWRKPGDVDLYLQIGARQLNANLYPKYVPAVVPESLSQWLASSLGRNNSGEVSEVGFLFRGTLNTPDIAARSYQLYLEAKDAELNYHSDWPGLRGVNGRLLVDDGQVDAWITSARVFDSQILPTRISARPNPEGEGALLKISGGISGLADDGLRVLRESRLRQYVRNRLDTWTLAGQMETDLELTIPLGADAAGADHLVAIRLHDADLEMTDLDLSLHGLGGQLWYSSAAGFSSEGLTGRFFDQPVRGSVRTHYDRGSAGETHISVTGAIDIEQLAVWSKRPELLFLDGTLSYHTDINLIHQSDPETTRAASPVLARVKMVSDLAGIDVDLPAPYGKAKEEERNFALELELREKRANLLLDYRVEEQILAQSRMLLNREQERLMKLNLALGREAHLPIAQDFVVSGYLPELRVDAWQTVEQRYREYRSRLGLQDGLTATPVDASERDTNAMLPTALAGLPLRLDLVLGQHQLGPLQLHNLAVKAWQQEGDWHLEFNNPLLIGALEVPADRSHAMKLNIRELHLSRQLLSGDDALADTPVDEAGAALTEDALQFHPRDLPRTDVTVAALFVDGNNYGNWSLRVKPDRNGVLFDDIRGNIRGLTVSGIQAPWDAAAPPQENTGGAQVYWVVDDKGPRTRFIGSLAAENLADVLQAWDKPDIVESTRANYQVDLTWPGAPGEFSLVKLEGNINLLLEYGRFKRDPGAGEGILRLFALVNFDSLARRLRLDFSDLYKSGLAYDQIQGQVSFKNGMIFFVEPLQMQSPSSRMQMAGSINLIDETIDTRLIAALPVAGNLTFLAAFATGLPAAAGIYLVSKIFRKQVDQATSVSYSISGSWDEPRMKFDRLFESESSLRDSVNKRPMEDEVNNSLEQDPATSSSGLSANDEHEAEVITP